MSLITLLHLPSDTWTEISAFLMPRELVSVSQTCTQLHQEMARPIKTITDSYESFMNRYELSGMEPESQRMDDVTFTDSQAYYNRGYTPTPIMVRAWRNAAGQLHRMGDLPAVIYSDGSKEYYTMGKRNRENDKPAVIWGNYSRHCQREKRKEWWTHGKRNRANGLPAIMLDWYKMSWYVNGELHRTGGPAIITTENFYYYNHGVECYSPLTRGDIRIGREYEMDQFFNCNIQRTHLLKINKKYKKY